MARIDLAAAPPAAWPRRFLDMAPLWSLLVAVMLFACEPSLWSARWHPHLLALTHAVLLGICGNIALGALLQFLSAAAGSPPRMPGASWWWVLLLYNFGTGGLVSGLWFGSRHLLLKLAAAALLVALLGAALALLDGLRLGRAESTLRRSVAWPIALWPLTAALGNVLVDTLSGADGIDARALTDVHALLGAAGVFMLLLMAVGRVVLPTLLGTRPAQAAHFAWTFSAVVAIVLALMLWRGLAPQSRVWVSVIGALLLIMTVTGAALLSQRPRQRNRPMACAWSLGLLLAAGAGVLLLAGPERHLLSAFVMLLGAALPTVVQATALEISVFLAWMDLHRRLAPGLRKPGVHALLPDGWKWLWLILHGASLVALLRALHTPDTSTLQLLAGAQAAAAGAWLCARYTTAHRVRRFLSR